LVGFRWLGGDEENEEEKLKAKLYHIDKVIINFNVGQDFRTAFDAHLNGLHPQLPGEDDF
jgi:hypothetical protein